MIWLEEYYVLLVESEVIPSGQGYWDWGPMQQPWGNIGSNCRFTRF